MNIIIISFSHIHINCILIFVRLVFTLISLCNLPLRPKQILIICLYDRFLVITGSMLKFVTEDDMEPAPSTDKDIAVAVIMAIVITAAGAVLIRRL